LLRPIAVESATSSPPPTNSGIPPLTTDRRDGAGKNGQHGRPAPPSLKEQLQDFKDDLAELKANQGSKKQKDEITKKINNIQQKIDRMPKGENHSMKAKGTGGGRSR
jgi:TolA-binding protein